MRVSNVTLRVYLINNNLKFCKMKDLEELGMDVMSANELQNVNGGGWLRDLKVWALQFFDDANEGADWVGL